MNKKVIAVLFVSAIARANGKWKDFTRKHLHSRTVLVNED